MKNAQKHKAYNAQKGDLYYEEFKSKDKIKYYYFAGRSFGNYRKYPIGKKHDGCEG